MMNQDTRERLVRLLIVGSICLAVSSAMRAQKPGTIAHRARQTSASPALTTISKPFARSIKQPNTH